MATNEPTVNGVAKAPESDSQSLVSTTAFETGATTTSASEAETAVATPTESQLEPTSAPPSATTTASDKRWPGWPGDCVFRLIVPVLKVGSIIGRKGELIKKMCEETRARIRVLDGAVGTPDRIVLISGKEEPDVPLSPAMDAVIRVFKRVSGLSESEVDGKVPGAAGVAFFSIRLLVASTQAINLIGKQGSLIKSIQENTGASVRVLSGDEVPFYAAADERIVELQGEGLKVLKALEAVIAHLRKFLVDHSVLPLFEKKTYNAPTSQEQHVETWADKPSSHGASQTGLAANYPLSAKRESLFLERENQLESQIPSARISLYGQDPSLPAIRSSGLGSSGLGSSGLGRTGAPIVTQIAQTMQIPLTYAEDIIGIEGSNIAYIRRTSGAILTVQESMGLPDEITVEIKGTSTQVQLAQQLIQEVMSNHKESLSSSYGRIDTGLRSSYSQLSSSSYPPTSLPSQPYSGGYGSSSLGGFSTFRL
ncbi:RNA-binding KH domain-containing protein PEPPER [Humulus lupulus]|uniref:RNA-binding KH domain-containing protein PEPPER n=1 Tax=Humulus lupulus TaxID=3486 RepID=UPI002B415AAC|nr:RNA-binding KH domain-containing protein PEPPER [Humulus lupulus]